MICKRRFSIMDERGKPIRFAVGSDVPEKYIEAYNLIEKGLVDAESGGVAGSPPDSPDKKPAKKAK